MIVTSAVILFVTIVATVAVMFYPAKWVTSIREVSLCLLAASWLLSCVMRRQRIRVDIALIPLCGIILWALLQMVFGITVYPWRTWISILYWTANAAAFFVGLNTFGDKRVRGLFFRCLIWFGFAVSILATVQSLTPNGKIYWVFPTEYSGWNLMGPFVYHNQYSAFIELLLPIAVYQAVSNREWRIVYLLVIATFYASVIVSGSRAGFVIASAELILTPMLLRRRRAKKTSSTRVAAPAGVLVGMLVLLVLAAGPDRLIAKFGIADPYAGRREFAESSLDMIRARPVRGVGLGNWATAYPAFAKFDDGRFANQAHNDWVQWAVEGGVPLLGMMLWLAILAARRGFHSPWGCGVAAVFIHCIVDYPIQSAAVALVFFSIFSAISVAYDLG